MSLIRIALRRCAVEALKLNTWAGERVQDSEIGPIEDDPKQTDALPFISVYTDDSTGEIKNPVGRSITMVFEIGVTSRTDTEEIGIPPTDAGLEFILDILERQLMLALHNPDNVWAELWKSFFPTLQDVQVLRGANYKNDVRYAGRQIRITGQPLPEPSYGKAPSGKWLDFLSALQTNDKLAHLENLIRAAFGETENWPQWKQVQSYFALTSEHNEALGQVTAGQDGVTFSDLTQDTTAVSS